MAAAQATDHDPLANRRLWELVNDLLDLARIEAGGLRLAWAPLDLIALMRRTSEVHAPHAAAKGLTLRRSGLLRFTCRPAQEPIGLSAPR